MTDATLSTVRNAARLLKTFLPREEELGVSELARRLELGKSSVHRLLATLTAEGLVEQDPRTGQYRLGLVLYELGDTARMQLGVARVATPVLVALRDGVGESAQLGIAHGPDVLYVERAGGFGPRPPAEQDRRSPLYCTAEGKVLLAFRAEPARREYLRTARLTRLTGRTITEPDTLDAELTAVRRRGYAESVNEREVGTAALAAPVRDAGGTVVAAVGIVAPLSRFRARSRPELADAVAEAARTVSRRLGWTPDNEPPEES